MAKKQLSRSEEFEIMKLVLDKFLWLGVGIMGFGFYKLVVTADFWTGLSILVAGVLLLLVTGIIILIFPNVLQTVLGLTLMVLGILALTRK